MTEENIPNIDTVLSFNPELERQSLWGKIKPTKGTLYLVVGWCLGMLCHPLMY